MTERADIPDATVEVGANIVHIQDEGTRRAAIHLLVSHGVLTADEVQAAEDRLENAQGRDAR